jgi:plasmid stability protein
MQIAYTRRCRVVTQLTVRDVPDEIVHALREESRAEHRSINAVVRAALTEHVERRRRRANLEAYLPEMDRLRRRVADRLGGELESSADLIREDRER